jgi:hypothetical protein
MKKFQRRGDNQIMGLELLSISLGLWSFQKLLRGRKVVVHSDNTGAEVSPLDPCRFLHLQCFNVLAGVGGTWICAIMGPRTVGPPPVVTSGEGIAQMLYYLLPAHFGLLQERLHLHIVRVATDDNIADLPSRLVCWLPSWCGWAQQICMC